MASSIRKAAAARPTVRQQRGGVEGLIRSNGVEYMGVVPLFGTGLELGTCCSGLITSLEANIAFPRLISTMYLHEIFELFMCMFVADYITSCSNEPDCKSDFEVGDVDGNSLTSCVIILQNCLFLHVYLCILLRTDWVADESLQSVFYADIQDLVLLTTLITNGATAINEIYLQCLGEKGDLDVRNSSD